ncbi:hypothetical protein SCWH03_13360 [Streptomyces pacificus]|uniref:Uncharacterized protein n=1 Tax=Streptomyces pacificus TaxID=2705029 RepID=A0A6A0AQH9_9ACTN|nr:hypothetical protein SCWH03_13360 [Streptomyces pacificus]
MPVTGPRNPPQGGTCGTGPGTKEHRNTTEPDDDPPQRNPGGPARDTRGPRRPGMQAPAAQTPRALRPPPGDRRAYGAAREAPRALRPAPGAFDGAPAAPAAGRPVTHAQSARRMAR